MHCKDGICMNDKPNINCCIHCENKCESPCEQSPNTCGKYNKPLSDFKKDVKSLLENNAVYAVTYNDIDRGEISLHLFGNNSITIIPVLENGEAKLKIEMTHTKKERGII